jgi:ABC-type branched-subunit amino acid transport system ATPase component
VTFEAAPGALVAVTGPTGSGRTALLLALTGRMRTAEGTARVAGLELPRRTAEVRRVSGVAHMPGVTDLDPALTVAEHLRERALVGRRYGGPAADLARGLLRSPRARARAAEDAARADAALEAVGLVPGDLPKGTRTAVRDLTRAQELRLSVALALLGRPGRPAVIAVDDADLGLSGPEREEAVALLASLAASGTTVLAAFREAPPEADLVVPLAPAPEDTEPRPGRLRHLLHRRRPTAGAPGSGGDASARPRAARANAPQTAPDVVPGRGAENGGATGTGAAVADGSGEDRAGGNDGAAADASSRVTATAGAEPREERPADAAADETAYSETAPGPVAEADRTPAGAPVDAGAAPGAPAPADALGAVAAGAPGAGEAAPGAGDEEPQGAVGARTREEDADAHAATGRP